MKLAVLFLCFFVQHQIITACTYGQLRLSNGNTATEGRLEICINNVWGTVCDDYFTNTNARVVCRQLGYPTSGAIYHSNAYFGSGTGSIWLDDVYCTGSESTLLQCSHNSIGSHNCGHSEDVSVICENATSNCTYGQLRLSNGNTATEGRLEICIDNVWGTVCDDGFTNANARVVCRQLGYSTSGATYRSYAYFGSGTGSIWLDNVYCTGSESTLLQCSHNSIGSHNCGHYEDVSVICSNDNSAVIGGAVGGTLGFIVLAALFIIPCLVCCAVYHSKTHSARRTRTIAGTVELEMNAMSPSSTSQQSRTPAAATNTLPPPSTVPAYTAGPQSAYTLPPAAVAPAGGYYYVPPTNEAFKKSNRNTNPYATSAYPPAAPVYMQAAVYPYPIQGGYTIPAYTAIQQPNTAVPQIPPAGGVPAGSSDAVQPAGDNNTAADPSNDTVVSSGNTTTSNITNAAITTAGEGEPVYSNINDDTVTAATDAAANQPGRDSICDDTA